MFVKGRQILDSSLIANECIDWWQKMKVKGLVLQIDMEKAYDNVNWNFLLSFLCRMGFGERWCKWIKVCVSLASFSVLVNGVSQGFFPSSRGLCQGDPLSSMLLIMVAEALSLLMKIAVSCGLVEGCRIGDEGPTISMLQFADDSLFFLKLEEAQAKALRGILLLFKAASGLKMNLQKSKMIAVGRVDNVAGLTELFDCQVANLPVKYLGLPLGARFKSKAVWEPVVERVQKRLASWKGKFLSKGGKLVLMKSVISSMPLYFLSLVQAPTSIIQWLEKIRRDFLWEDFEGSPKFHLMNWNQVCKPLDKGGLGVRSLKLINRALLGK